MFTRKNIIAYCIIAAGGLSAPMLPFFALAVFPILAVILNAPVAALLFALLLDSFLLPADASLLSSLSLYTILFLPVCMYIKHGSTL